MIKKNPKRFYFAVYIISTVSLIVFFLLIHPESKPLPYIFAPVVLVWFSLFSFLQLILRQFMKNPSRLVSILISVAVSLSILLLLLSGVGQLTVSDVVLAAGLVAVSTFYFYRSWGWACL